jgi:hypothetical protein
LWAEKQGEDYDGSSVNMWILHIAVVETVLKRRRNAGMLETMIEAAHGLAGSWRAWR